VSGSAIPEAREAERGTLHALDEVVHRLGRSVACVAGVPGDDLVLPTQERVTERAHLDRVVGVGHVGAEALDELECEFPLA